MVKQYWPLRMFIIFFALFSVQLQQYAGTNQSSFSVLTDAYFQDYFETYPSKATAVGIHEFDGRLEKVSLAEHKRIQQTLKVFARQFEEVSSRQLSQTQRNDLDIIRNHIQARLLEEESIQMWRKNPDLYSSRIADSIFLLVKRNFASPEKRLRSVILRENQIPDVLLAVESVLDTPPRVYVELAIEQLPGTIEFFEKTVPQAFSTVTDVTLLKQFTYSNNRTIEALRRYQKFLTGISPDRLTESFALGATNYSRKLAVEEMITTSLDQLFEIALAQLRADQKAFVQCASRIDPSKTPVEVLQDIRRDHPSSSSLITTAQRNVEVLRRFLIDRRILSIPRNARAIVIETPPFLRSLTFAALDTPGPLEKSVNEAYCTITPPDPNWPIEAQDEYLQMLNYSALSNILAHEVWPGHYAQFLATRRVQNLSRVRQLITADSNTEGWAHYCEQMVLDQGYANNDPKFRLAQLHASLLRDCRFIAGLSLHTKNMTIDQAVELFRVEGYQSDGTARMEAKRGTIDPTYITYTLGKLEILRLKEDYRRFLGARFSLMDFHMQFILSGSPPIEIVRREMLGRLKRGIH